MESIKEFMADVFMPVVVLFGAVVVLAAVLVISIGSISANQECKNLQRLTGLETDASISLGCMAKYKGRWVSADVVTKNKQEVSVEVAK